MQNPLEIIEKERKNLNNFLLSQHNLDPKIEIVVTRIEIHRRAPIKMAE